MGRHKTHRRQWAAALLNQGRLSEADALILRQSTTRGQRREIEGEEQAYVVEEFERRHPAFADVLIHPANGGSRANAYEGYRLKRQGVKKGVSDLFLPVARGGFFGLWVEYKAAPPYTARVTGDQKRWIRRMEHLGYRALVCTGPDEALAVLDTYLSKPPTLVAAPVVNPTS